MSPNGLAVDSSGNLFKVNGDGSVEKITSTGSDVATVAGDGGDVPSATEVAIDPASGDLYVDTGGGVAEFDFDSSGNVLEPGGASCTPAARTKAATRPTSFGSLGSGTGLAFDPTVTLPGSAGPGALYVADQASDDVTIFVPPAPAAPSVLAGERGGVRRDVGFGDAERDGERERRRHALLLRVCRRCRL